jgi:magnesium chelatase family protein
MLDTGWRRGRKYQRHGCRRRQQSITAGQNQQAGQRRIQQPHDAKTIRRPGKCQPLPYDVAIAVGILAASGQLPDTSRLATTALVGELALDGAVRPVTGVMSLVAAARAASVPHVIVAAGDEAEAACVSGIVALPAGCWNSENP